MNNSNIYIKKSNSTIDLGGIEEAFNIKERFPGIDTDKITITSGASLDKVTGIVSRYVEGTPITYTYDCGINRNQSVTLNVTLNFTIKALSSIAINDDLNKVYDGTQVGLWTMLVGLSTGMMMFFRRKNRKEEV